MKPTVICRRTIGPSRLSSPRVRPPVFLVLLAGGAACAAPPLADTDVRRALADTSCSEVTLGQIQRLGVSGEVLLGPPSGGTRQFRLPTEALGTWVTVSVDPAGASRWEIVSRGTPEHRRAGVDADCRIVALPPRPVRRSWPDSGFTDGDLKDRVASAEGESRGLVVYAWSPHMPLSVDGWAAIAEASRDAGLDLVPVLIEGSARDFARREAARSGIPDEGLREVASVELVMRDIQVHAPSVLVFADRRVSRVLPGYRNAEGYRGFLQSFLGEAPRPAP